MMTEETLMNYTADELRQMVIEMDGMSLMDAYGKGYEDGSQKVILGFVMGCISIMLTEFVVKKLDEKLYGKGEEE